MSDLFILAGNGSYKNRGCEAIVRGTAEIIRAQFKQPKLVIFSYFENEEHFRTQQMEETDPSVYHMQLKQLPSLNNHYLNKVLQRSLEYLPITRRNIQCKDLSPYIKRSRVVLSVGGDNYSLDYGLPTNYIDLDDYVLDKKRNLVIWGASIGPFAKIPKYEQFMSHHLKKLTAIFVREQISIDYLKNIHVIDNVYKVVDPAFAMNAKEPNDANHFINLNNTIGINLSPMMSRYVCSGDDEKWLNLAIEIIAAIYSEFQLPILLVPHVFDKNSNDYAFLSSIKKILNLEKIEIISEKYSAAELKWFISKLLVFAGSRTHSTIASFSSGVPTISFSYSNKAKGLTYDIYGNLDYCIDPSDMIPKKICEVFKKAIDNEKSTRQLFLPKINDLRSKVLESGSLLKTILSKNSLK